MEKINFNNVIKSIFLGAFIGMVLQFADNSDTSVPFGLLRILAGGGVGFVIGFITEWVTAILPISLANPRNYFFINNLIALAVTSSIMIFSIFITQKEISGLSEFMPMMGIVLGIVLVANVLDYFMYIRAQNKLKLFKESLRDISEETPKDE